MEDKKAKNRKNVLPTVKSFTTHDASGWMFKLIHEGWLRKRWRKRYCVLSSGILYSYEQESSDGTEKTCGILELKSFEDCVRAPRKECKKSPNTLILEPIKPKGDGTETKNTTQATREFFYTEKQDDLDKWISKIKESISLSIIGANSKLKHVTKSRARPPGGGGGNRRPPTKQHLKERAMMSEVAIEESETRKDPPKPRGHIPSTALKPPSLGKSPAESTKMAKESPTTADSEVEQSASRKSPKPPSAALKPPSTKRENKSANEEEQEEEKHQILEEGVELKSDTEAVKSNFCESSPIKSPAPPPAALKPPTSRVNASAYEEAEEMRQILEEVVDEKCDMAPAESNFDESSPVKSHVLAHVSSKPCSTKRDEVNVSSPKDVDTKKVAVDNGAEGNADACLPPASPPPNTLLTSDSEEKNGEGDLSPLASPDLDEQNERTSNGVIQPYQNGQAKAELSSDNLIEETPQQEIREGKPKPMIIFHKGPDTDNESSPASKVSVDGNGSATVTTENRDGLDGRPSSLVLDS